MASSVETVWGQLVTALATISPSTSIGGEALRSTVQEVSKVELDIMSETNLPKLSCVISDDKTTTFEDSTTLYLTKIKFRIVGYCKGSTGTTGTNPQTYVSVEMEKLVDDVRRVLLDTWLDNVAASPAWVIDMEEGIVTRRAFNSKVPNKSVFETVFSVVRVGHCLLDA